MKGGASEEESAEVGGAALTMYDNLDAKSGDRIWTDLCRGPHVPTTRRIPAFSVMRSAAAYWRGSEKNPQLQRIYGTAWASRDDLKAYLNQLAEAAKRDHRKLGQDLDLFSFPDELGSGLAVFHPKGGILRKSMEDYSRAKHLEAGYEFVNTPHITKSTLYEVSGHLQWYADGMYPPMHLDEEVDADGTIRKAGQDYYLKPMNCPMHCLIFDARGRSYRELPLRLFEFGSVYRYEKSGVIHGLTRVRGMTQDDAHIYCTIGQMRDELTSLLTFVLDLLRDFGLDRLLSRAVDQGRGQVRRRRRDLGARPPARWRRSPPSPGSSWCLIPAARRSTVRRSRCRSATRSGAPGRCRRSSSTSTCPSGSSSRTSPTTATGTAR